MNAKTVYTYGAFDLLHPGHVILLEKAKALGTCLIVGVVADEPIKQLKGNDRPIMNVMDRMKLVSSLKCVDKVVLQPKYDPTEVLKELPTKVDILVKGDDWEHIPGTETIEKMGGKLVKLPYSQGFSTSDIVKKIRGRK
jgi:rfaE bifunctional protein nucleotidyltransferase chain/domain